MTTCYLPCCQSFYIKQSKHGSQSNEGLTELHRVITSAVGDIELANDIEQSLYEAIQ